MPLSQDGESVVRAPFRVGEWRVEPLLNRISRGDEEVRLRPRAMAVLVCLADRAGQLAEKQHIIDTVWRAEFVSENALTHVIGELRTALGDDPQHPTYIETIPRRGYRLVAVVALESTGIPVPVGKRWSTLLPVAAAVVLAVVAVVFWLQRDGAVAPRPGPRPRIEPDRVVVAGFDNHTGDPGLYSLGLLVADSITNSLYQIEGLQVAINPYGSMSRGASPPVAAPGTDPLLQLAELTRSGLVVAGACYLRGDEVQLQARVVDPWNAEIVQTFEAVQGPRADPSPAIGTLRQNVAGALAAHFDATVTLGTARPVPLAAYQEYRAAMAAWGNPGTIARLERTLEIAPDFSLARTMLAWALAPSRRAEAAEHLAVLEGQAAQMTPFERTGIRAVRAMLEGSSLDLVSAARESARLAPGVHWIAMDLGMHLLRVNRPREAVEAVADIPFGWTADDSTTAWRPFTTRAEAHHLLGEYEAQLAVATASLEHFPDVLYFHDQQVSALAAMGRVEELARVVEASRGVPARRGTPGRVMQIAAAELRAHGLRDEGIAMATRLADWYRSHPDQERGLGARHLASALYAAESWDEALPLYKELAAEHPDDVTLQGLLGVLAARRGDRAEAQRIGDSLGSLEDRRRRGWSTLQRACIAAQLGEPDRALDLLRQAFADGLRFGINIHRITDLEPLWDDPRFVELMAPKG